MEVQAGKAKARLITLAMVGGMVFLTACSAIYRNHGYVPTDSELEQVQVGTSSRQDVADAVGRPSAAGLLNDQGWYYVQSEFKHLGPKKPEEIDRQVVAISFNDAGIVENVERFGLQEGRVVPLSRRVTDSNIKGVSFLRQLFNSVGRVGAGDLLGE
ncbi:Beta-barrel assembly machine subunit BamE [Pseudorhodobacter antarcticus]|jgi:outer membrane protein assembly factor BamE (lipoprotein component of BamABCDE complex)|uniref:Beta-barrel assembly machine subunit BamE n=1 Tax=Pseudorhodobacter antarcticus TaxID=1077947 RepID=A0A1H8BKX3_9RHOB|nr:outer membrane protein assembly factor BamE [Pseudorhodobacter antarcticus]SEM83443.1 Beta-barrel assembly machine subunit BamE [Pseudorhodobacter antarcticus]